MMLAYTVSLGKLQKGTLLSQQITKRQPCLGATLYQGTHCFVNRSLGSIITLNLHPWPSSLEGTNQAASLACGHSWGGHLGPWTRYSSALWSLPSRGKASPLAGKVQKGFL